jgi:hypothetical protein
MDWIKGHETFKLYKKNTRPMLTEGNRLKQVEFSKHVRARWNLPIGSKILWTMSDEKWWWGLVARTFAKLCPELGIDKTSFVVHHKEHITKVMGHATVGYLFTDDPENGGEGYCIGLHRCESFRVALKTTYETERDPITNAIHHNSKIVKHRKGDLYRVAANVTGSNTGTPTDPKFPLLQLWEVVLLPALDSMVAPGGPCAGAIVVHQEDNAGPHKEGVYAEWLQAQFDERGWKLELQAPQGPYTNVLDLQLFPCMSKRHSELLQLYCNSEASFDRIWNVAIAVWKSISSAMICRSFVLAYRIMEKIIATNGHNDFLQDGAPHCNVRRDYVDTERGIKRKRTESPPESQSW